MFKKIFYSFFILLILLSVSYGDILEFKQKGKTTVKLYVIKEYPEKQKFYVKEPVKVRIIIGLLKTDQRKIAKNIKKIYENIKVKTLISEGTVVSDTKSKIESNRLIIDCVVYFMREYDTDLPFLISIDTQKLKKVFSEDILKVLEESFIIKSEDYYRILPVPDNITYVGSFDIKTEFEDQKGFGTFFIIIEGTGFPYLPKYSLVVKNGSAKKTGYTFEHNLEKVRSIQKYKIVYMDELEIKPVRFKYFDPYQEKIVEKTTDKIVQKPKKEEVKSYWENLEEKEKLKYYISRFRDLYPEEFEKRNLFNKLFISIYNYRYQLIGSVILFTIVFMVIILKFSKYLYPYELRDILCLKGNRIEDYKKIYRYISTELYQLKDFLKSLDIFLYQGDKVISGGYLKKVVISGDREIYPQEIKELFRKIIREVIRIKSSKLSKREKVMLNTTLFLREYINLIFLFIILLAILLGLLKTLDIFPDYRTVIFALFLLTGLTVIFIFYLLSKPKIKVK